MSDTEFERLLHPGHQPVHEWGSRPPTSVWPPCPPEPCPPGPWPAGLYRLNQCWDDVAKTKAFLAQMMREIIAEDPSIIAVGTPVVGVTDGTEAQPGMVGQFIQNSVNVNFVANTNLQAFVNVASLPPGDWDCWWNMGITAPIFGTQIYLDPVPAGFSGDMDMVLETPGQATPDTFFLASPHVRALTKVANPMVFSVAISPGPANGYLGLIFNARRRR